MFNEIIAIRGGGDIATGVVQKFKRSGFKVVILECEKPTAIRLTVSLSNALYVDKMKVEDIVCEKVNNSKSLLKELNEKWNNNIVPLIVDPNCERLSIIQPDCVIDAIIAKYNVGTQKDMAKFTIALGPGFEAPKDVDAVIETMRGHYLGKLILNGQAVANTGIPGEIGGKSKERVIHATVSGKISHIKKIGSEVEEGELIFKIGETLFYAPFHGIIRGLISEEVDIKKGMKIADIDPRLKSKIDCFTISDKARCIGGATLEAYLHLKEKKIETYKNN